jgi:hypothetical protein
MFVNEAVGVADRSLVDTVHHAIGQTWVSCPVARLCTGSVGESGQMRGFQSSNFE